MKSVYLLLRSFLGILREVVHDVPRLTADLQNTP